jgi:hypothetical protein
VNATSSSSPSLPPVIPSIERPLPT